MQYLGNVALTKWWLDDFSKKLKNVLANVIYPFVKFYKTASSGCVWRSYKNFERNTNNGIPISWKVTLMLTLLYNWDLLIIDTYMTYVTFVNEIVQPITGKYPLQVSNYVLFCGISCKMLQRSEIKSNIRFWLNKFTYYLPE